MAYVRTKSSDSIRANVSQTLIWSGACQYDNRNIFGFRPIDLNGEQHLSFYLERSADADPNESPRKDYKSSAILMNNRYQEIERRFLEPFLDLHEVNFQADGNSVLLIKNWPQVVPTTDISGEKERRVAHGGFSEVNTQTGEVIFNWHPLPHNVTTDESCDELGRKSIAADQTWDYFHLNSVEKTARGDYLISARHTSTVYKISGKDGHVIWRLGGGHLSDFEMEDGLPFHWQHDARSLFENDTHSIISLLDNGCDDRNDQTPIGSTSGKIILLDTASEPRTAKILRRFERPDGQKSCLGGNLQVIGEDWEASNIFVNWVVPGLISEYDADNRLVFEARLDNNKIKNYRAFKYPFIGRPKEPPVIKVLPLGLSQNEVASAFYVSWNGATEIAAWAFYGAHNESDQFKRLSTVKKRGFETAWVVPGVVSHAYAEALNANGEVLGKTAKTSIEPGWSPDNHYKLPSPILDDTTVNQATTSMHCEWTQEEIETASPMAMRDYSTSPILKSVLQAAVVGFALFGVITVGRNIMTRGRYKKRYVVFGDFLDSP